jgi:hypothetical protein
MTIDEMKQKLDEIAHKNAHWKKCQDGSYERALDEDGYWKLLNEYRRLTNEN